MATAIKVLNAHVVNILSVYDCADITDHRQGECAYENYYETMRGLAKKYFDDDDLAIEQVCGVFAALSPNATYASNLLSTESVLSAFTKGRSIETAKVSTYGLNKQKAWDILTFDSRYVRSGSWTQGKKTYAFYRNIYGPGDLDAPVVVDGHMYSVWINKAVRMNEAKVGNGSRYDQISEDIRHAARVAGITPSQMQAVCWFTWKRINRISYDVRELQHRLWVE